MSISEILQSFNPWWKDPESRLPGLRTARRDLQADLLSFVLRQDRRAGVLLGPRQVGKTTILLQIVDDLLKRGLPGTNLLYFDFSDERIPGVSPRDVVDAAPSIEPSRDLPRVLLLDEITRFEGWDLWLKQAVDRQPHTRILATDSAAGWLRRGGRESGQGRWDEFLIEGLSFREFIRLRTGQGESPGEPPLDPRLVELFLALGGLPEFAWNDASHLTEVHRRIRVDIAGRAVYRDLAQFDVDVEGARILFAYLVQQAGGLFDPTARARDIGVDPRTASKWLDLLEGCCLLSPLERRTSSAAARTRSRRKIYPFDHALVPAFSTSAKPTEDPFVRGASFETAVFRELRGHFDRDRLGYFRQRDLEIDFVVDLPTGPVAVEVTASARVRPEKLSNLEKACRRAEVSRVILVHGGYQRERKGIVDLLPLPAFLLNSKKILEAAA